MNETADSASRQLNALIDKALLEPSPEHQQQLKQTVRDHRAQKLAERIRQRATLLGKHYRSERDRLLLSRDELILAVYAAALPDGWSCAWSDGASIQSDAHRLAAVGGLLMDGRGIVIERISRQVGDKDTFEAEVAAVVAIIQSAVEHNQLKLWVYSDNYGLVQMWHEQRYDSRLDDIRAQANQLDKFALREIPRLHNQPANALARQAIKKIHGT